MFSQTLPDLIFPKCYEDFKLLQSSNDDETLVVYTVYDGNQRPLFRLKKKKIRGVWEIFFTYPPRNGRIDFDFLLGL
jgi:hypothetical protein